MRFAATCAAVALTAILAACSGGPAAPETPTMPDDELLALGKQVVECMRDNGVTGMPDPFIEAHRLTVPEGEMDAAEEKAGEQTWAAARKACQEAFDRIPQGALAQDGGDDQQPAPPGPEDVEKLRELAQCYRENGVPEWPDPDSDGRFPLEGTALREEEPQPGNRLDTAHKACMKIWSGPIGIS
ncbi:MAG TPA: hypothetical protein VN408_11615 [Actinoplanes sp.]|nr:hypothetical protein [Actinoplanes sp.]